MRLHVFIIHKTLQILLKEYRPKILSKHVNFKHAKFLRLLFEKYILIMFTGEELIEHLGLFFVSLF